MHAGWINLVADATELLAGGLVVLYCRQGLRRDRGARTSGQELGRVYPDLDRDLDLIWHCYPAVTAACL